MSDNMYLSHEWPVPPLSARGPRLPPSLRLPLPQPPPLPPSEHASPSSPSSDAREQRGPVAERNGKRLRQAGVGIGESPRRQEKEQQHVAQSVVVKARSSSARSAAHATLRTAGGEAVSGPGALANRLLQEFEREAEKALLRDGAAQPNSCQTKDTLSMIPMPSQHTQRDLVAVAKDFADLVAGVEEMLSCSAKASTIRMVRIGEEVEDQRADPKQPQYYKVQLPARHAFVVVSLARQFGPAPVMYGSTTSERPTVKTYEVKGGKEDRLVYEHHKEDEQDGKWSAFLYIAVEAELGLCSFRLAVSMRAKPQAPPEGRPRAGRLPHADSKNGWQAKLRELKADEEEQGEFVEHIRELQKTRIQKSKQMKDKIVQRNILAAAAEVSSPSALLWRLEMTALRRLEQEEEVMRRRKAREVEVLDARMKRLSRAKIQELEKEEQDSLECVSESELCAGVEATKGL